jgi:hypothetical protein
VTVVLAYLIHANAWTLKTAYAYVAERRKGISPNIGFVAELMSFEETELGIKHSGGVNGESSGRVTKAKPISSNAAGTDHGRIVARHIRESLPPTWAAKPELHQMSKSAMEGNDLRESQEGDKGRSQVGDDREVRKDGHWVHHRRQVGA